MDKIQENKEIRRISDRNKYRAEKYFEEIGELPKNRKPFSYVLHHIDTTLRENDVQRYIQWNPEDLVVMPYSEHSKYHNQNRTVSDETRQRLVDSHKGKHWYNNGTECTQFDEGKQPEGWVLGRLDNGRKGCHHSTETIKKISESNKRTKSKQQEVPNEGISNNKRI